MKSAPGPGETPRAAYVQRSKNAPRESMTRRAHDEMQPTCARTGRASSRVQGPRTAQNNREAKFQVLEGTKARHSASRAVSRCRWPGRERSCPTAVCYRQQRRPRGRGPKASSDDHRDNFGDNRPDQRNTHRNESQRVEHLRAPSSVVEHVTFNHGVPGSIPGGPTNK